MPRPDAPSSDAAALRAALPTPLDVMACLGDGKTFRRAESTPGMRREYERLADAERAACVASAFPLFDTEPVHPAPFYAAMQAVAWQAVERAGAALWDMEHVAEALERLMIGQRLDVEKMEALTLTLSSARRRAESAVDVIRETMEASPERLPAEALTRLQGSACAEGEGFAEALASGTFTVQPLPGTPDAPAPLRRPKAA